MFPWERSFAGIVEVANKFAVNDMAPDGKRGFRNDLAFAIMLVAAGLAISGISLARIRAGKPAQMAQADVASQGAGASSLNGNLRSTWRPECEYPL
jgi:hypothetical protein